MPWASTMTHDMNRRWYIAAPNRFAWHSWEDDFLVYDRLSGQTHLLNLLAAAILRRLEEAPATAQEIGDELRQELAAEGADALGEIPTLLSTFDELGLIAPLLP